MPPNSDSLQSTAEKLDLSFVFPCLNEERTLHTCVTQVMESLNQTGVSFEVIVADNGSSDKSREIAAELGCRVVPVTARGYGSALRGGIEAAKGEYVMFADSDSTYIYSDAARLYECACVNNADMAIASRISGDIEVGAMPALHRWLGTPVLTFLINALFGGRLTDCNSGFRCIRKSAFRSWQIRSNGMEFASELLIKALKSGAVAVEIASGLRKGPEGRVAHLRTWRDGMRHLLFIFSEKPKLFEIFGFLSLVSTTLLQFVAIVVGPVGVAGVFHVFDMHSQSLLLLGSILGTQFYLFSCMLYLQSKDQPLALTQKIIHLNEGVLFFTLLAATIGCVVLTAYIGISWSMSGFGNLNLVRDLLFSTHMLGLCVTFSVGLLSLHVLKKAS